MSNDTAPPSPGAWPDASLWPDPDAPPIAWARFYRDHCGWIVLPTAGPIDVLSYARNLAAKAATDYVADHGEEPDEDTAAALWDDAMALADATLGRPIGYIYNAWMRKVAVAADVTDDMLRVAWEPLEHSRGPRCEADRRGIAILPNRSAKGLPVVLVDVDPSSGGDPAGPWGMGLPGPKASTPGGGEHVPGVHTLMLATGKETASADLGPGVDVVAAGTPIPLPAGSATPGRRWLRLDAPVVAPDALRKRGRKKPPPRPGEAHGAAAYERQPGDDEDEHDGQGATIVSSPVGDGERNRAAGILVGILARPRACPEDFVVACLELLAEDLAANLTDSERVREEAARWRHLLTRGPRDADFAAEVLETWLRVRDTSRTRMRTPPAKFAASVWRVCDRREEGQAGAEDYGYGPPLGVAAPPLEEAWRRHVAAFEASLAAVPAVPADPPPPYPPPSPEQAAAAVAASKVDASRWRGGIDPRTYLRTLAEQYTDDDLAADQERSPIQIGAVYPAIDFVTLTPLDGGPDAKATVMHGWGEFLGRDLGGIAPRDFRVIGAANAGAGKTWFEGWLAHGLALATASRILGVRGYEDAPLILPVWLTEMPKPGELFLRLAACHLGMPMDIVTEGTGAASSPRVAAFAARLGGGWTPDEVVRRGRDILHVFGTREEMPFAFARKHVIRTLAVTQLPRVTRHLGVAYDHRGGVGIVDHLADAIDVAREDLAKLAGVSADKVLPLALVDPGQRFTSSTESSEKRAIDGLFEAIRQTLCLELGAAVIATSDTTKAAAREASSIDVFLSKGAAALGADIFAGSQAIQHQADCIALQAEPAQPGATSTQTWVRIFKSRAGGSADVAYPFKWEMGLGRFTPLPPEPLRAPSQQQDRRGRDSSPPTAPIGSAPFGLRIPRRDHGGAMPD